MIIYDVFFGGGHDPLPPGYAYASKYQQRTDPRTHARNLCQYPRTMHMTSAKIWSCVRFLRVTNIQASSKCLFLLLSLSLFFSHCLEIYAPPF